MAKELVVDVGELIEDPKNARKHSKRNLGAITASLQQFGAARSIVVDKSGVVRAGNGTLAAAKKAGIKKVRVIQSEGDELVAVMRADLSDAQAAAYALADNRTSDLSDWNNELLLDSLQELKEVDFNVEEFGFDEKFMKDLLKDMGDFSSIDTSQEEQEEQEWNESQQNQIFGLRPDVIFSSANKYGIPDLKKEKLGGLDCVPNDIWTAEKRESYENCLMLWGTNKFPENISESILGFYVDDQRFEVVWNNAVQTVGELMRKGWKAVIEPDFSVWRDDPMAVQLWNRYRSQWVARYWQEAGIKIIPSLNWSDENSIDFCCAGIPIGCELVSLQCRTTKSNLGKKYFVNGLNSTLKVLRPSNIMIYGGITHRSWIEPSLDTDANLIFLDDWASLRQKRRNTQKERSLS